MPGNLATWKAAMVIAATALVAACGHASGNGGSGSRPTSAAASSPARADSAMCQDAAALRTSLENILGYQAGKDTIAGLRADLGDANAKLAALRATRHGPWSPQLTALETALKKLQKEAANPAVLHRPAGITRVLADVRPKAQTFIAAAKAQCPELSALRISQGLAHRAQRDARLIDHVADLGVGEDGQVGRAPQFRPGPRF